MNFGGRAAWTAAFAAVFLLALASPATAQMTLTEHLNASSGYDSNIYYRAGALPDDVAARDGVYLGLDSRTELTVALGSHHLTLRHQADLRQMLTAQAQARETSLVQGVLLGYMPPPLWGIRLMAAVGLDQMYLRHFNAGGWNSGVCMLRVSRGLGARSWLSLAYILNASSYNTASSATSETTHRLQALAAFWLTRRLQLESEYLLSRSITDPRQYSAVSNRIGILARWDTPALPLQVEGGYQLLIYSMAEGSQGLGLDPSETPGASAPPNGAVVGRLDLVHAVRGAVSWRARRWLDVGLEWRFLWGQSDLDSVEDYSRHQVVATATFRWQGGGMERPRLRLPPQTFRPAQALRADHLSRDASEVAVVGNFNRWDAEKNPMLRHRESWSAVLQPPPGLQQYMISVDGKITPPQNCERWINDGFGGRNCVVFVAARDRGVAVETTTGRPRVLLGVEALAELPVQMGGRLWAELPGRIRISTTLGAMPGFYLSAINTALTAGGALDNRYAKLFGAAVEDVLVWRVSLGWRPSARRGVYFSMGYMLGLLDGFLPIHLLEVAADSPPLSIPGLDRYRDGCTASTSLHMVHLELGWQWSGRSGLSLRLALGAALTASSTTTVTAQGVADSHPEVTALLGRSAANIDELLSDHIFTPTITLAVGWQVGL